MTTLRLVAVGTSVLIAAGCDGHETFAPANVDHAGASRAAAVASQQVEVSGPFDAIVDFSTLSLTPRGSNCLLQVSGRFVFHGAIDGVAMGQTTALVFGRCEQVASTPPGTDPDVFVSEATFDGTVAGVPAQANVRYQGRVAPGGHIDGHLIFSNGVSGVLDAEAQVAVGGTYHGSLVVH
ncbi:MAG TPA: hypothetical protein VG432_00040 [Gemmatimonadaceae bacterium]|nr:hypothetical protein [Gemmatimonadaceae bacterium]